MNKNFEDAYRAEVQHNIPDLWDRIESGLPEKSPAQSMAKENIPVKKGTVLKETKKKPYAWIKWASLAAACMLVLLVAPVVIGIGLVGTAMNEDTAAADEAMVETYYDNAMPDMDIVATDSDNAEEYFDMDIVATDEAGEAEVEKITQTATAEEMEVADSKDEYNESVVEGLYVEVTDVTEQEEYYEVVVEFSDMSRAVADEVFGENEFYLSGALLVRVYPGKGEMPVLGERYCVNIYNTTEPGLPVVPYCAELESGTLEQY